jgi:hypothetical protein
LAAGSGGHGDGKNGNTDWNGLCSNQIAAEIPNATTITSKPPTSRMMEETTTTSNNPQQEKECTKDTDKSVESPWKFNKSMEISKIKLRSVPHLFFRFVVVKAVSSSSPRFIHCFFTSLRTHLAPRYPSPHPPCSQWPCPLTPRLPTARVLATKNVVVATTGTRVRM